MEIIEKYEKMELQNALNRANNRIDDMKKEMTELNKEIYRQKEIIRLQQVIIRNYYEICNVIGGEITISGGVTVAKDE